MTHADVPRRYGWLAPVAATLLIFQACSSKNEGDGSGAGGSAAGAGGARSGGTGGAAPGGGTGAPAGGAANGGGPAGTGGAAGAGGTAPAGSGGAQGADGPGDGAVPAGGTVTETCKQLVQAANAFLNALGNDAGRRAMAALPFASRRHFKYTPGTRPGLPLAQMSMEQRDLALALVRLALSQNGYQKAETIRMLELVLRAQEGSQARDPLGYYLAIYGTPAADGDWAFHWEGHHLSLHYTLSKCTAVADAPSFFGTNPARVDMQVSGAPAMGTRGLAKEEDLARALAMALSADGGKRLTAIGGAMREVQDSPAKVSPATPPGLAAAAMSPPKSNS